LFGFILFVVVIYFLIFFIGLHISHDKVVVTNSFLQNPIKKLRNIIPTIRKQAMKTISRRMTTKSENLLKVYPIRAHYLHTLRLFM